MKINKSEQKIISLVKEKGIISAKDLNTHGISRNFLYSLTKQNILTRHAPGLYVLSNYKISEHIDLIEISKRYPKAIISLLSALSFHGITTQLPHEVWISLPRGSWVPKRSYPSLNVSLISQESYNYGIETHALSNTQVRIFSLAKTISDCFKFRNKIGLDIAIEALRESLQSKKVSVGEIYEAAKINRVQNIMQPFLESLV